MGSKTQSTPKEKKSNECKSCDRTFQTVQALRSHQNAKHPNEEKSDAKQNLDETNVTEAVKNTPTARVSKRLQLKKGISEEKQEKSEVVEQVKKESPERPIVQAKQSTKMIKTEFSCPKCTKVFPVYFHAQKHIQKRHKDIENDESSSKEDLKPIRTDTCTLCSQNITEEPSNHKCEKENTYKCLDCERSFNTVKYFNEHVVSDHNEGVDNMMLKNNIDFTTWKSNMELQVKLKYTVLDSKQCYQCSYVSPKNLANLTYLCPSMIISEETSDGVKVQYFKKHSGHTVPQYKVLPDYKNKFIDNTTTEEESKEDLYKKFKSLMNKITLNAAKADVATLKKLMDGAVEMQELLMDLTSNDTTVKNKSMTDDQITEVLEGRNRKRKTLTPIPDGKKSRLDSDTKPVKPLVQSPSFNDSYKQFVDSSCKLSENKQVKKTNRKVVVKTKMGQFSPKKTSPVNDKHYSNILKPTKNNSDTKTPSIEDVDYEIREQENDCNILVLKI